MKKIILTLFALCSLSIYSNEYSSERILSIKGYKKEYDYLSYLYMESGKSQLSKAYPFTVNEFITYFDRIESVPSGDNSLKMYNYLKSFIEKDIINSRDKRLNFDLDFTVNAEGYYSFNTDLYEDGADFNKEIGVVDTKYKYWDYKKRKPFLDLSLEGEIGSHISFSSTIPIKNDRIYTRYTRENFTNIPISTSCLDQQIPQRGFISFGSKHITAFIGRDQFSVGNGYTGKMHLSNEADYHDGIRISTYWEKFKYTFHLLSFDSILVDNKVKSELNTLLDELYDLEHEATPDKVKILEKKEEIYKLEQYSRFKTMLSHTFEFTPISNLSISITESAMFGKRVPELRDINPLLLYHNSMIERSEFGNALLTLDVEYIPVKKVKLYGSITLDQYASPVENERWEQTDPNALGYMLGAEYLLPVKRGFFNIGAEGVKTDPFLYLDDSDMNFSTTRRVASLIDDVRYRHEEGVPYTDPLGYRAGNDALVLNIRASYQDYSGLYLKVENNTLVKGDNTLLSEYIQGSKKAFEMSAPSGNRPEIINTLSLAVNYSILDNLHLDSSFAWVHIDNFKDRDMVIDDFQLSLSLSLALF